MITILDYGLGNVLAFQNVYKRLDIPVTVARNPDQLVGATRLILPGVGAFDHAMDLFGRSGLREPVEALVIQCGVPVLGICVGMQMLANSSEEGVQAGLGWIPGTVRKFRAPNSASTLQLPHMGWNDVAVRAESGLLPRGEEGWRFYFLHSYHFVPEDVNHAVAMTDYAGEFASAVRAENVYGVQFHPEKSHHFGAALLKNFAELA